MSELNTRCPHCRVKIKLKNPEYEGKQVKCPGCSEPFVVRRLVEKSPAGAAATAPRKSATAKTAPARKKPAPARKSQDIDFPVDDDEVLEAEEVGDDDEVFDAEEVADDAGGDDWLSELDSLAPKGPIVAGAGSAPAPSKRRPKTNASSSNKKKRRRSMRDADGEFPLWLHRLMMIGTGIVAGALCVIVWAAVVARSGSPSPYMATVVGVMVGGGVRLGASKWDFGLFPALTAAVIALVAIVGGKVYGVSELKQIAIHKQTVEAEARLKMVQHEYYPLHLVESRYLNELENEGFKISQRFKEPWYIGDMDDAEIRAAYDPERIPAAYGEAQWKQAQEKIAAMTEEQRRELQDDVAREIEELNFQLQPDGQADLRKDADQAISDRGGAVGPLDLVFAVVALVGAFKFAAGMSSFGGDDP